MTTDKRSEFLSRLRAAKSAHLQWRAYAQALVAGVPLDNDKVPVLHTDCKFGQWYYGDGQDLAAIPAFQAIEGPHEMLHKVYMEIFKKLFGEDDRSRLQKLFGSTKQYKAQQVAEANELMDQLIEISKTLLEAIDLLEIEIKAMSDAELDG